MPTFSYKCRNCGADFKLERKLYEMDSEIKCFSCGTQHPERIRKNLLDKFYFMFEGSASSCSSCSSSMA
ncbi:MAG: FmdB family zinc ribbon protein [Chloroflexota bacterium]